MTTQEAVDYFAILFDKYGSPNLIEDEIVDMLNHGVNEYLNRLFPDSQGGVVNFEYDANVVSNIRPLIYSISSSTTSGLLSNSTISTALQSASGDADTSMFRVISAEVTKSGSTYPVKYAQFNNLPAYKRNYYKNPSTLAKSRVTLIAGGLQFYPTDDAATVTLTVVKKPKVLSLSPVANPELDDYVMYNVIAIALQLAGVSTRDEELIQDIRNITVQAK